MSEDWWDHLPNHPANQPDVEPEFTSEDLKDLTSVEIEGIDPTDHPEYGDAFVAKAVWFDRELTDEELEIVNDDNDFVYKHTMNHLENLGD
jgi:UDP-N-acetylmuramyl tripeptide synthase